MADVTNSVNGERERDESSSQSFLSANDLTIPKGVEKTPAPGDIAAPAAGDESIPPPPRPLPEAVTRIAAELLVAPEHIGPAGLPIVAGYELLRPLGRGGMGLVYQARQVQCGRIVALKMILGGAHARPRDLARFRMEAEAVSHLEHPHIVSIYEVGEHAGWAYFALEYVAGGNLARRLAGKPQPAAPSARLIEAVARAMAYAHERGVVHRDLKPGNILLTTDGTPKVTDFGLAKRLDLESDVSPSRGHTQTGDILGTPSYMAPEQTAGRPSAVGPAADVYALGAILYECLTGRPPFSAATQFDTLLQVRGAEPVPPRRLAPTVPRDLDTICLKCLQKEPRRRYASAAALADDLRRFLAGVSVHARPASAWERMARWARRRKAVAALAGISAAAIVSLIALGAWHEIRLQCLNTELRVERDTADQLRDVAQAQEADARQQREQAEAHFRSALAAVKQMLVRVSEQDDRLAHEPHMELVRGKLLEDAIRFYQGFLKERPADPEVRFETASTALRLGDIRKRLGQQPAAEETYRTAIDLFQNLTAEFPKRPEYRHELAGCYSNLGSLLANTSRQQEAEAAFLQARELQQKLVDDYPSSVKYRSALAGSEHNLATLLAVSRRLPEAEQALTRALAQRRRLADESPLEPLYRRDLARTLHNLGMLIDLAGRPKDAEAAFREALDLQRRLVADFPRDPSYRQELAGGHNGLANALDNMGRSADAEKEYAEAIALQARLADEFPRVTAYRHDLAHSHYNLATVLQRNRPRDAEQSYRRAFDLLQRLADESPGMPALFNELGRTSADLAELLLQQDRAAEAREQAEQAVRRQQAALKLQPKQPAYARALSQHYRVLSETQLRLGDHTAAAQTAAEIPRISSSESANRFAAGILARCIPLVQKDTTLDETKRKALVGTYGDRAMAFVRHGFHRASADQLKTDPHLAVLRSRADFQELIQELTEGAAPPLGTPLRKK